MRVVEASSFIAAPLASLYLAQMGAEVIRIDPIGGGPDFGRWPVTKDSHSFYWEGLNKAKKSIAVDMRSAEGRDLVRALVTAPGDDGGLFITNFPANGFLSHDSLTKLRQDLITVRVMGTSDGRSAVDYTVNSAIGLPMMTGPGDLDDEPVNHVLPAWDLQTGCYAAFSVLVAERHRSATGQGQEIRIPLADVAISSIANIGQIAEVLYTGADRERIGNDIYGAFGRDFLCADGKRLMVVAITERQWKGLISVLSLAAEISALEIELDVSFEKDEVPRYIHRERLNALIAERIVKRTSTELASLFDENHVCWGPYRSVREAANDPVLVQDNPIFSMMQNKSGFTYPVPGAAATIPGKKREQPNPAPQLGADSEQILMELLNMSSDQIGRLIDKGLVAIGKEPNR